jgi:hypothetical protein
MASWPLVWVLVLARLVPVDSLRQEKRQDTLRSNRLSSLRGGHVSGLDSMSYDDINGASQEDDAGLAAWNAGMPDDLLKPNKADQKRRAAKAKLEAALQIQRQQEDATLNGEFSKKALLTGLIHVTQQTRRAAPLARRNKKNTKHAKAAICRPGEYEAEEPTPDHSRKCLPFSTCYSTEYESSTPTAISDRVCARHTICQSTEFESSPPTTTSDRQCIKNTICDSTEYESAAPTTDGDRVCARRTICDSNEFEASAPTTTGDRQCTKNTTYHLRSFHGV